MELDKLKKAKKLEESIAQTNLRIERVISLAYLKDKKTGELEWDANCVLKIHDGQSSTELFDSCLPLHTKVIVDAYIERLRRMKRNLEAEFQSL